MITAAFHYNDVELRAAILDGAVKIVNDILSAMRVSVEVRVKQAVTDTFASSREYLALNGRTRLQGELGVADPEGALNAIAAALRESVTVKVNSVRISGTRLTGGMRVELIESDFSDLLRLSEASFTSFPSGEEVPWLKWLLLGGSTKLVNSHFYLDVKDIVAGKHRFHGTSRWSRTNQGIMVKSDKGWAMPPEFVGTQDDNWITRAFAEFHDVVVGILEDEFVRNA